MNTQAHNNNYDNVSEKLWTVFGLCAYLHAAYVLALLAYPGVRVCI